MSRLPTTTASATSYSSSISARLLLDRQAPAAGERAAGTRRSTRRRRARSACACCSLRRVRGRRSRRRSSMNRVHVDRPEARKPARSPLGSLVVGVQARCSRRGRSSAPARSASQLPNVGMRPRWSCRRRPARSGVDQPHRLAGLRGEPAVLGRRSSARSARARPSRCPGTTADVVAAVARRACGAGPTARSRPGGCSTPAGRRPPGRPGCRG